MMADSNSSTSTDRTEDLDTTGDNPTRDTLAEGLLCLIRPTIDNLETQVSSTLSAQSELKDQIVTLQKSLKSLQQQQ